MLKFIFVLFILILCKSATSQEITCESDDCNFSGLCKDKKGVKTCNCVNGFSGSRCENVKDFCDATSCKSYSKCVSYPGNFNCICNSPNEYSDCSKSLPNQHPPQNVYFFFNPVVKLNQEYTFVIAIEKLGNLTSTVEVSVPNDVWLNTQVSENDPRKFQKYPKLVIQNLLRGFKLRDFNIPHEDLFVSIIQVVPTKIGSQSIKVIVKKYTTLRNLEPPTVFNINYYNMVVYKLDNYCSPVVTSKACEDVQKPREVLSNDFNVFKPIIERSCGADSVMGYQWFIDHFVEDFTYKVLPGERTSHLRLPPFAFQFDDFDDPFMGFYAVKLIITEENLALKSSGTKIWRCFVKVQYPEPQALIKGGPRRKVSINEKYFVLDASESKDYGTNYPPEFHWTCKSTVDFCKTFKSLESIVKIKTESFEVGDTVEFNVVINFGNTKRSAFQVQKIEFVESPQLRIWIKCLKNCPNFAVPSTFHAEVICDNCQANEAKIIEWKLNAEVVSDTSEVVIASNELTNEQHFLNVTIEQNGRKGEASIVLTPLDPTKLNCSISPLNGIEFDTNFIVKCNVKIIEVYQEGKLVERFYAGQGSVKLKAGMEISVRGFETPASMVETILAVKISKLKIYDIGKFIRSEERSLQHLIAINDIASAGVIVRIAVGLMKEQDDWIGSNMDEAAKINLVTEIMDELLKIKLFDPESIVILTDLMELLIESIRNLHHNLRAKFGMLLEKIASKIQTIPEMRLNKTKTITSDVQAVVEKLTNPLEIMDVQEVVTIPLDQRFDDYPEYENFDSKIIERMENFLSTGNNIEEIMKALLEKMTKFVPAEPLIEINFGSQKLEVFTKDFTEDLSHRKLMMKLGVDVNGFRISNSSKVTISKGSVTPNNRIKIGFTTFKSKDPFWFVKNRNLSRSDVTIIQVFNKKNEKISNFSQPIKIIHQFNTLTPREHHICVRNFNDMPRYQTKMSKFSKLLVEYKVAHGRTLNYYWQFNKNPQFKDFIFYREINGSSFFEIASEDDEGELFIAFLPSDSNYKNCTQLLLRFHKFSCEIWNRKKASWTTEKCKVGEIRNLSNFDCFCDSPGSLSAVLEAPSVQLDAIREYNNVLPENFIVIGFLTTILSTFFVSAIFIFKRKTKNNVIYLKSNRPDDDCFYVIKIFTGAFKGSGTSSKICMKIFGSESQTNVLWLENEEEKFTRKSEWKFVVAQPTDLGEIEKIMIWIKPSGHDISWYCEKICVVKAIADGFNIESSTKNVWVFHTQKWFSLEDEKFKIIHEFLPTKHEAPKQSRSLFFKYLYIEFSRSFLSTNVIDLKRHIPNVLSVCMIAMIFNSYFYDETDFYNIEDENSMYRHFQLPRVLKIATYGALAIVGRKFVVLAIVKLVVLMKQLKLRKLFKF